MAESYADAKIEVEGLVERFARNLDVYKRPDYKEAHVRVEFIDPFFEALGWDVRNVQGYAEQYKDVIHEDAIKVGGATRAPDYCFRIGGVRKFFLEAKKPSVLVKGDVEPAYQLRRYAWSAKLPLSILTDFEEFAVYDCRQRPNPTDKASVGRIMYLTFDQYLGRLDDIYGILAKESVLKGSFDRYVQDTKGKRGTSEVDAEFLKEIEGWRDALARNIALRNPALSVHELNFAVQRTIDRIIFLRMCEDRAIEDYGRLLALTSGPHTYPRLGDLYRQADEKYDSDLFDFQADTLSKSLTVDDKVLKPILAGLYYPQSPYEFSVLPAEILGQVYEQFLGKVIRLTPGHRAKVEEKPEVKKAGGVYYTPTYIVDYIVKQTVGRLVEGRTPRQISKLRVLDPACGSGSFLLGAYQYLLDYHRQWYEDHDPVKHARGKRPALYQARHGEWRLTPAEKKRILLNNIYGVDIDRQAVEVTKLSLLLKVLEGENQETLGQQLALWRERALPDLGDNIKCGNSLIGPGYYEEQQLAMFDDEEIRRVNAFDWQAEFSEIMAAGGFDAVIGNPPWVSLKGKFRNDICSDEELDYLTNKYSGDTYRPNIYEYFVKRAISLTGKGGFHSFIVPDRLGHNRQFASFRKQLIANGALVELAYRAKFPYVVADTLIYCYSPGAEEPLENVCLIGEFSGDKFKVRQGDFLLVDDFQFLPMDPVIKKLYIRSSKTRRLGELLRTSVGFIARSGSVIEQSISIGEATQPVLKGRNVFRYRVEGQFYFRFTRSNLVGGTQDIGKLGTREKILMRKTGYPLYSAFDDTGRYPEQSLYFLYEPKEGISLKYVLGIVNSSLFQYVFWNRMATNRDATPQLKKIHLDAFPIRVIEFDDPADKSLHDKMVALVERVLALHKKLATATIPADKQLYQRQIEATDRQIDALVYELYGLTEEEIAVVEGMS